jgi:hypothetical protein
MKTDMITRSKVRTIIRMFILVFMPGRFGVKLTTSQLEILKRRRWLFPKGLIPIHLFEAISIASSPTPLLSRQLILQPPLPFQTCVALNLFPPFPKLPALAAQFGAFVADDGGLVCESGSIMADLSATAGEKAKGGGDVG